MNIGDRVRLLRINKGMTQEELANRLGYKSKTSVAHIENGKRDIPRSVIVRLADILCTTPAYLMGWDDDMIKAHEILKTITDNEKTSQQQKDKDAYIDGMIDASKPFDNKPEFPPKKKLKHMGAQPIKIKNNAPVEVDKSVMPDVLRTFSTAELERLSSLSRDQAAEVVKFVDDLLSHE